MEQMYLLEIFVDKVTVFIDDGDEGGGSKNLIVKTKFGPKTQFIIKEGQLAVNDDDNEKKEDVIELTESGRRQWSRKIRVGKSLLFNSYADTVLTILSKFPLEIEIWNDDENELPNKIYVGVGTMYWHTRFFTYLKETADTCKIHESLAIKEIVTLYHECCCAQAGEISLILRLSALGTSIVTEFQQLMHDPERFCFRTDKAPSMFECKRVEGDDPNFCMVGSIYETTTLEDPSSEQNAQKRIEICTELQSCGVGESKPGQYECRHGTEKQSKHKYFINKVRMGDITGPCGNTNCPLAHKVRKYIRNLDSYKAKAGAIIEKKTAGTKKICGTCGCKDDRWHREDCPGKSNKDKVDKVKCYDCGGMTKPGDTCEDKRKEFYGTGTTPKDTPKATPKPTPKSSKTQVNLGYVTKVPVYKDAIFRHDYIIEDCMTYLSEDESPCKNFTRGVESTDSKHLEGRSLPSSAAGRPAVTKSSTHTIGTNNQWVYNVELPKLQQLQQSSNKNFTRRVDSTDFKHLVGRSIPSSSGIRPAVIKSSTRNTGTINQSSTNQWVYNVEALKIQKQQQSTVNNCTETSDDKECKCSPPKPSPPCKTFDCNCIPETRNIASRKAHRPYCPLYTHKSNCPVTMMNEEEGVEKKEDEEDETEPLPYGLPPVKLGPCPVMGRPCSVPDGFAKMYKNAILPAQPPSYSDAGRVCCSKEYERIKKALKEYMKYQKDNDMRCVNKYNVDTERRCCDKEQVLMSLMGRDCCGTHKMAIQLKFKEEKR